MTRQVSVHRLQPRGQRGFTLIEVMIVVAIVAILSAIAYPTYRDSVLKGRRAEARTALMELMQQQERYMTQNNTYMTFAAGAANTPFNTKVGRGSPTYNLSAEACPASGGATPTIRECVRLVAAPTGADPVVGDLRLTSTGVKDCTPGTSGNTPAPKICWP